MADRFWVGGNGTWNNSSTTNWAATSGGASGASAPTSTDNAIFDANSGLTNGRVITVAGTAACNDWTVTGPAVKDLTFSLSGNFSPSGAVAVNGNSGINRILIASSATGTARTLTIATLSSLTNIDFMDITGAGAAAPFSGTLIGDCGGNASITFTAAVTQTWSGTSGGNWSANAWTTRAPLPQDDVVISSAFGAVTITFDMPRLGKNLDYSASTGAVAHSITGLTAYSIFGSLTLRSGMGTWNTGGNTMQWRGRGSHTITRAGVTLSVASDMRAPGGTYALQDAYTTANSMTFSFGTFATNNFNVEMNNFVCESTSATLNGGTSTWTVNTTSNVWRGNAAWGGDMSNTIIVLAGASASSRTFAGGGRTYGILRYTVANSSGTLIIQQSNSFSGIEVSDTTTTKTLHFTASTTTTIRSASGWLVNGRSGALVTVTSVTAANHTISCATGTVSSDYLNLSRSTATGGASFYAGANSTDSLNNTGWVFTAPPAGGTAVKDIIGGGIVVFPRS